ncbi:unnamed protein product [Effrenium voratum]|nr:unnamed protein product [Effrenium voratum]
MFVLGAGSLGCLWAARLARGAALPGGGPEARATRLLLRPGSPKASSSAKSEIRVTGVGDIDSFVQRVQAEEVSASNAPIERLLLVTKAQAAEAAMRQVAPRLQPGAVVVLLCNGALALQEQIGVGGIHVVLGLTTHGAWSKADFDVVHAGWGDTRFGKVGPIPESLYQSTLQHLETAGLGATDDSDIRRSLWLKLAANAVINPMTALSEKPNGFILDSAAQSQVQKVCQEVADVAKAMQDEGGSCPSLQDMLGFVRKTASQTADNMSSMLQDIRAGRSTEIDFINGWVVAKALQYGIEASENARLVAMVKQKERMQSSHQ